MKVDISDEIKQYNDIVERGIKRGEKKKLQNIKKAIKDKNGSLRGVNKYLHKIKWHKKGDKEMRGGFLGSLLAMASPYIWKGAKWAAKKGVQYLANKAKDRAQRAVMRRMRGRGHDEEEHGKGFRLAGGSMETESRESHKQVQKYATKKDRSSYFIPTKRHMYEGGFNTGFLDDTKKYLPKIKGVQPGTGEMEYFGYSNRGAGFRHMGSGFRHVGGRLYDARILPNKNIRY